MLFVSKTMSGFGSAVHAVELERSITDETDRLGLPVMATGVSLCGLSVRVMPQGTRFWRGTRDQCSRCARKYLARGEDD